MTVPLYIVRHADAGDRAQWHGPDHLRPLSAEGIEQAAALVERFDGIGLGRLASSPHVRCIQTLEPLGVARTLGVEPAEDLAEGTPADRAIALLSGLAEAPVAVCSHGDVIQAVVEALIEDGLRVEGPVGFAKGSVWELHLDRGRIVSGRYRPPR